MLRPHLSDCQAARSHCLMEYGGLASTTSNLPESISFDEGRIGKGVPPDDVEVFNTV